MSKQLVVEKPILVESSNDLIANHNEGLHLDFLLGKLKNTGEIMVAVRYVHGNWGFFGGGSLVEKGEFNEEFFTTGKESYDDMYAVYTLKGQELTFVIFDCMMDFEDPYETGKRYSLSVRDGSVEVVRETLPYAEAKKFVSDFDSQEMRKKCEVLI